jgi:hypothetical protein
MIEKLLPEPKLNSEPLPKSIASAQLVANAMLCAVHLDKLCDINCPLYVFRKDGMKCCNDN